MDVPNGNRTHNSPLGGVRDIRFAIGTYAPYTNYYTISNKKKQVENQLIVSNFCR